MLPRFPSAYAIRLCPDIWTFRPSSIVTSSRCPSLGIPLSGHPPSRISCPSGCSSDPSRRSVPRTSQLLTSRSRSAPRVPDPISGLFRRASDISLIKSALPVVPPPSSSSFSQPRHGHHVGSPFLLCPRHTARTPRTCVRPVPRMWHCVLSVFSDPDWCSVLRDFRNLRALLVTPSRSSGRPTPLEHSAVPVPSVPDFSLRLPDHGFHAPCSRLWICASRLPGPPDDVQSCPLGS
ncbi:hypothetical protein K438DRAFT_1884834 [Mycena galopus ATCC 62051]|nr:hypothetical protein K438DRAFT_1884834 [Mycena galopus ATCC 62051]